MRESSPANRTVYFPDGELWEKAKRVAHMRGEGLGVALKPMLEKYVADNKPLLDALAKVRKAEGE